jgi:hypothetical protein
MAGNYCELEIRIDWHDEGRYFLSARFMDPVSDQENQLLDPLEIRIDLDGLRPHMHDPDSYGKQLTGMLFGDAGNPIRSAYSHARTAAADRDGLRVRLTIQASAPELHGVFWETLLDPDDGSRLATREGVWFSRFASAKDFRLQPVQEAAPLEALIVVASPSDLEPKWSLAPIDGDLEAERVEAALDAGARRAGRSIHSRRLSQPASVYNIVRSLRERYADILCLVCHGALIGDDEPRLMLEREDGTAQSVDGRELVERLRDMRQRPRLILLGSCESAGDGGSQALAAIGPRLAAAGVPSVIAMQGKIALESAGRFLTTLFAELVSDGQIDRAVAVARSDLVGSGDWWIPVLFMRIKTGRLWPASTINAPGFDRWDAVVSDIENEQCVPVLGTGLVESILGSTRDIARKWAERYEFPLAPRNRDDLAQVAQYLTYRQSKSLAINELRSHLVAYMRNKYPEELTAIGETSGRNLLEEKVTKGFFADILNLVGEYQRSRTNDDVHALLARLPFRVFINANRNNLLREALREAGKSPQILLCNWIVRNDRPIQIGPQLPDGYEPTVKEPLVFHVFGNLEYEQSLVLTEDDYFDFLINVTRNETLNHLSIPGAVTNALASSGLLLLGFHADDWDFRVLFRGVLKQPGDALGEMYARVAAQISPTEGEIIDPDRAGQYLQGYFQVAGKTATYWGTAEAFVRELAQRCAPRDIT